MVRRVLFFAAAVLAGCSVRTSVGDLPEGSAVADTEGPGAGSSTTTAVDDGAATTLPATSETSSSTGDPAPASSTSTGEGSDVTEPAMTSFAIRWGDIPPSGGGGDDTTATASSTTRGGSGRDDDDILVVVGFTSGSCEDPFTSGGCGTWSLSFLLDASRQEPGTYQLADDVDATVIEQGPDDTGGSCFGTGGTVEGVVVIEDYSETEVLGRFESVVLGPEAFDLDGFEFTAPRC
ncbi:MAG: hypothetical protein AAGA54_18575 [Myxococcota bacterium]